MIQGKRTKKIEGKGWTSFCPGILLVYNVSVMVSASVACLAISSKEKCDGRNEEYIEATHTHTLFSIMHTQVMLKKKKNNCLLLEGNSTQY